jgi:hypothetical protein
VDAGSEKVPVEKGNQEPKREFLVERVPERLTDKSDGGVEPFREPSPEPTVPETRPEWMADKPAACTAGEKRSCYPTGAKGCEKVAGGWSCKGICRAGFQVCSSGGTWGACQFFVEPQAKEECNTLDDNCDGFVDEGLKSCVVKLAGGYAVGLQDGSLLQSTFQKPGAIISDAVGHLYVLDNGNFAVRKVDAKTGRVTTLAGGAEGTRDGIGATAHFKDMRHVAYFQDASQNEYLYITTGQGTIRRLHIGTGQVDTIKGLSGLFDPHGIAVNDKGVIYVTDKHRIMELTLGESRAKDVWAVVAGASQSGVADGTGATARFKNPEGLFWHKGSIYVADFDNHTIRKLTRSAVGQPWTVTTIAGTAGTGGHKDGAASQALLTKPYGLAMDANENLYISQKGRVGDFHVIRKLDTKQQMIEVFAGSLNQTGTRDDTDRLKAQCYLLDTMTVVGSWLYVSELVTHRIRRVDLRTVGSLGVLHYAGQDMTDAVTTHPGATDGNQHTSALVSPFEMVEDKTGLIWFVDKDAQALRTIRVTASGDTEVKTPVAFKNWKNTKGTTWNHAADYRPFPRRLAYDSANHRLYIGFAEVNERQRIGVYDIASKTFSILHNAATPAAPFAFERSKDIVFHNNYLYVVEQGQTRHCVVRIKVNPVSDTFQQPPCWVGGGQTSPPVDGVGTKAGLNRPDLLVLGEDTNGQPILYLSGRSDLHSIDPATANTKKLISFSVAPEPRALVYDSANKQILFATQQSLFVYPLGGAIKEWFSPHRVLTRGGVWPLTSSSSNDRQVAFGGFGGMLFTTVNNQRFLYISDAETRILYRVTF